MATASRIRRRITATAHATGRAADAIIQSVAREVEVTRRLYRSGESEYLIDGQVCRLRDVHDLLMDTGLGAKAYAIIEQGKIGMILSSRPTDRRQLIEEAAGITKYKARRRAAELKLEAAQQNLTRIDDIVFEVEKQRGTLKRQAGKARRYQRLRDELRRWEKVLFARKYRQLAETIESARTRLADARERESVAAARVARSRGRSRTPAHRAGRGGDARRPQSREAAHARELAINRQQQQIAFDREQVGDARRARATRSPAELETLEARREPARAALAARREAAADAERRARSRRRRRWRPSRRGLRGGAPRDRRARSRRRGGAQRGVLGRSIRRRRCATRSSTPPRRATASARRCRKLDVEIDDVAHRVASARRPIARPRPTACAARTRRSRRRGSRARRANRSWPARASSTSGARVGPRRASTSSPASRRG